MNKLYNPRFDTDSEYFEGKQLAKEFKDYGLIHKLSIIRTCLILFNETVYDSYLFKKYAKVEAETLEEKAKIVIQKIYDLKDKDMLDKIYRYCWKRVRDLIPDNQSFN